MTDNTSHLSPAALTVWNAFLEHTEWEITTSEIKGIAAALRAAANEVTPPGWLPSGETIIRRKIFAIATELEATMTEHTNQEDYDDQR
jgi:hypothetical protein